MTFSSIVYIVFYNNMKTKVLLLSTIIAQSQSPRIVTGEVAA